MNEAAPALFVALETSWFGAAIRQSSWAYMVANVGHILALVVFAAAIAVMDLRMIGVFSATRPALVLRSARRVAILGFIALVMTGAVLFTAEASHVILNRIFQFKLGLIGLGLLNVLYFELFIARWIKGLPPFAPMPAAARAAGAVSLAIWLAVAAAGRSIAYF